jgi:hypothetical protein
MVLMLLVTMVSVGIRSEAQMHIRCQVAVT